MMRSLYSGVSGLQAHQVKMDIVANNIANVNTVGFKKSTVTFEDLLSQTIADGQAGTASTVGGINAMQIGTGVSVGAINTVTTQGGASTTGSNTDLMIEGKGYFILQSNNEYFYSRAGSLSLDSAGNLVSSANGMLVCDDAGTPINITGSDVSISADGTITYVDTNGVSQTYASKVGLATFINPAGLTKRGENMYVESNASGTATYTTPGVNSGSLTSGALEMSNVDLAQEFVDMITAERGYQANSKTIKTVDEMLQTLINLKN